MALADGPCVVIRAHGAHELRPGNVSAWRGTRALVCIVGLLVASAVIATLVSGSRPQRGEVAALLSAGGVANEGAMIKEQASEDNDRRENVAMQAETLRAALRAMRSEAPPAARSELDAARAELKKGAEGGSSAGLAALQDARSVLAQVVGQEAAGDEAALQRGKVELQSDSDSPGRMQSLTSDELSVPDDRAAWRERYMERYAACWPHCAPEANIMNTIDSTKYPYNEEAGGHTWTRWKIGHSGINAAYAQAERKYYNEGARVRHAARADEVYPNTLGPAYKAGHSVSSTSLLGHSPTGRGESERDYDARLALEWRENHPYMSLSEGARGAEGGARRGGNEGARALQLVRRAGLQRGQGGQMREVLQEGGAGEGEGSEAPGKYVWADRGGKEETNVWSTRYLREQSAKYYGSGHKWEWRDDSASPNGYYYNVLEAAPTSASASASASTTAASDTAAASTPDAASTSPGESAGDSTAAAAGGSAALPSSTPPATGATAAQLGMSAEEVAARKKAAREDAEEIVNGRREALSPAEAAEAAYEIVNGGPRPALAPLGAVAGAVAAPPAAGGTVPAAGGGGAEEGAAAESGSQGEGEAQVGEGAEGQESVAARRPGGLGVLHELAMRKKAATSVKLHAARAPERDRKGVRASKGADEGAAKLARVGINIGQGDAGKSAEPTDVLDAGDREVPAPPGGIAIGQIFRAASPRTPTSLAEAGVSEGAHGKGEGAGARMQELAGAYKEEWPTKGLERWATAHYATGNEGMPKNTSPDLPAVTFAAVPWTAGANVVLPVYR
jgi:hypothetical protein